MAMNHGKHGMLDETWLMDLPTSSIRSAAGWDDGEAADASDAAGVWGGDAEAWEHDAVTWGNLGPPLPAHPDDVEADHEVDPITRH